MKQTEYAVTLDVNRDKRTMRVFADSKSAAQEQAIDLCESLGMTHGTVYAVHTY